MAKIGFVSLGCPKALVDSESIITGLRRDGYEICPSYDEADLVIVNTCGFIDSAKAESLDAIGEALTENGKVIVTGCLGANSEEISSIYPDVVEITGPQQDEQVLEAVRRCVPPEDSYDPYVELVPPQGIKLTPPHYSYLKISEGCNHSCSFCIIPSMRGKLRSHPVDSIFREAETLVESGVREIMVISQDTSAYGSDIGYQEAICDGQKYSSSMFGLCDALGELGVWIRLHYVYPYPHVDEIITLMNDGKIIPYLDIPFQHGSSSVLKRMKRPATAENNLERIKRWREICPDITIRSTFIVGFPGETESEFQELLDFIYEAQLDRVGCFQYSAVAGARANQLKNPVPEELKQERQELLMQAQAAISRSKLQGKVGRKLRVIIDAVSEEAIIGRSFADAPEIDGLVYIEPSENLRPGDIVDVRVTSAGEHDLWGKCIATDSVPKISG